MTNFEIKDEIINELVIDKNPTKNNLLVILVGLPYSGKSTFAEKLSNNNFVHLWATKIKKRYKLNDEQFLQLSEKIVEELLSKNYNVVFDFLNHKNEQRKNIYSIAEKINKKYFILYLDIPKNIILKRQSNVIENTGRTNISPEIIDEIESEFEIPVGENIFIVKEDNDLTSFFDVINRN